MVVGGRRGRETPCRSPSSSTYPLHGAFFPSSERVLLCTRSACPLRRALSLISQRPFYSPPQRDYESHHVCPRIYCNSTICRLKHVCPNTSRQDTHCPIISFRRFLFLELLSLEVRLVAQAAPMQMLVVEFQLHNAGCSDTGIIGANSNFRGHDN